MHLIGNRCTTSCDNPLQRTTTDRQTVRDSDSVVTAREQRAMHVCSSVDIYISFNYPQEHIYSQQPQTHSVVLGCPIPETQTRHP